MIGKTILVVVIVIVGMFTLFLLMGKEPKVPTNMQD